MITFLYHLFANYLVTQYFSVTKILIGLWNTFIDNIYTRNIIDAMLSSVFVVIKYYLNEISLKVSSIFSYHFRWLMHFCSWLSSKKHPDTSCKGHFTPELPDLMPELSRMQSFYLCNWESGLLSEIWVIWTYEWKLSRCWRTRLLFRDSWFVILSVYHQLSF